MTSGIDLLEVRSIVRTETKRTGVPLRDEDLEQDASLKAVEAFRRECDVRFPRAFLRKIVGDAVRDHWRRRPVECDELASVEEKRVSCSPRFEEEMDRQRRVDVLRVALRELEEVRRATLMAFYMEECSVGELAERTGKSISAVKMELLRARKRLAEIYTRLENERVERIRARKKGNSGTGP
jgi:RNA polymerase sigma factor (sigma-70 family)